MINYDLHIHTEYCGHAEGMTIEAILQRADELKLDTICITDHIYSSNELDIPAKIKKQAAQIDSKCSVLIGAEIDVDGALYDGTLAALVPEDIDYVIAAIHYIPGPGNYPRSTDDNHLEPEELLKRWQNTLLGVIRNPVIDTLAHPGRMVASAVDLDLYFDCLLEIFAKAAPVSAKNNVMWELNELDGQKISTDYHDRWHEVYEIALDEGVKLIYGSDSHCPERIGQQDFVNKLLKKLPDGCLQNSQSIYRRR